MKPFLLGTDYSIHTNGVLTFDCDTVEVDKPVAVVRPVVRVRRQVEIPIDVNLFVFEHSYFRAPAAQGAEPGAQPSTDGVNVGASTSGMQYRTNHPIQAEPADDVPDFDGDHDYSKPRNTIRHTRNEIYDPIHAPSTSRANNNRRNRRNEINYSIYGSNEIDDSIYRRDETDESIYEPSTSTANNPRKHRKIEVDDSIYRRNEPNDSIYIINETDDSIYAPSTSTAQNTIRHRRSDIDNLIYRRNETNDPIYIMDETDDSIYIMVETDDSIYGMNDTYDLIYVINETDDSIHAPSTSTGRR